MPSPRAHIVSIIALAALPLVALVGTRIWAEYQQERRHVLEERLARAQTLAFTVEVFIESQLNTARSIALHPALAEGQVTEDLRAFLARVARANPDWAGIGVVGGDGLSITGTRGGPPVYLGDRDYFKEVMATGKPVVSSALVGRRRLAPVIVLAVPVELAGGGRRALLTPLPTERFGAALVAKLGLAGARLAVLDRLGQAFIHSDPARVAGLAWMQEAPGAGAALRGESGSMVVEESGEEKLVAYAPVAGQGWAVLIDEPAAAAFANAQGSALEHLLLLVGALALVFVIGAVLGGRLARAREDLEQALRTRDEFLAAASHDLRNPLTAIRASVDLLQRSLQRAGAIPRERIASAIGHIDAACTRMTAQIDAFLDVARLQLGAPLSLAVVPLDLAALVRPLVQEAQQASSRHSFTLQVSNPPPVQGDAARLQRVVANLLQNAVKYSPEGGPVEVRLERSADGREAVLVVADQGVGIPAAELERVFERFARGSNVAGRIPGTGLGLAGARQIVEQHGGTISVTSREGQGSSFTVRLPRK